MRERSVQGDRTGIKSLAALAVGLSCITGPSPALATSAQGHFGITLVIAPPCQPTAEGAPTDGIAGSRSLALDIAAAALGLPVNELLIAHDRADTGWWIVSLPVRGTGSARPEPVLRVEKCSGTIEYV